MATPRAESAAAGRRGAERPGARAVPLRRGLLAWMHERFPPKNAVFFAALFAAAVLTGRALVGAPARLVPPDAAAFLAAWAFFLVLRVLDEHKDFADDARHHPGRVLQRGLVRLRDLAVLGVVAAAAQLVVSVALDGGLGPITALWLATIAWSLLMAREFFIGGWLRPRLIAYAAVHMIVLPLAVLWMAQMGARAAPLPAAGAVPLCVLAFLSGSGFEVARKVRGPAEERAGVQTYTAALGTGGAATTLLFLVAGTAASVLWVLGVPLAGRPLAAPAMALVVAVAVAAIPLLRFRARPTARRAAAVERGVGLSLLLCYAVLIAVLVTLEAAP